MNKRMFLHQVKSLCVNGKKVLWYDFDTITSTMDYAVRMTREGCDPWTVVSADEQTSGKGTQGRTWFSPGGKGLWISVILPPPDKAENLSNLSILAAQALVQSFTVLRIPPEQKLRWTKDEKEFTELQFDIKHPNDVTVGGRKIAGILVESATAGELVETVVLGIGVNFQFSTMDFEYEGLFDATSFFIETGCVPNREQLIISFIKNFKPVYEKLILKTDVITPKLKDKH